MDSFHLDYTIIFDSKYKTREQLWEALTPFAVGETVVVVYSDDDANDYKAHIFETKIVGFDLSHFGAVVVDVVTEGDKQKYNIEYVYKSEDMPLPPPPLYSEGDTIVLKDGRKGRVAEIRYILYHSEIHRVYGVGDFGFYDTVFEEFIQGLA